MQCLDETIAELVARGVVYYGSGGAVGFDTMAAYAVLKHRQINPAVKLIMVLPCRDMEAKWDIIDKRRYWYLLNNADKVVFLADSYYGGCMTKRNIHLVENSSVCVSYMKFHRTGARQIILLALERGLTVINIADKLKTTNTLSL
jgi:uncharacterized phage-like protein YoqJ